MRQLWLDVEGLRESVWYAVHGGKVWFHFRGETHVQALEEDGVLGRSGKSKGTHPGQLFAPMPGKITKVSVSEGAQVNQGQPLVVMEAMKMEYTLAADVHGEVVSVACKVGDQVQLGALLVRVRPKGEPDAG